jgi:FtsZ-interacting cell division protein ZipA
MQTTNRKKTKKIWKETDKFLRIRRENHCLLSILIYLEENKTKQNRKERGTNENHHAAEDSELQQQQEAPKSSDEITMSKKKGI